MPIFYKATRPNGRDFYTGTVDYAGHLESGEWLPVIPSEFPRECCSNTVYHASTSKADTLINGKWPCRLFEVEGQPVAEEENKRGFATLRVVREIEAWEALGPNGESVSALIERAKTLTSLDGAALNAAWGVGRAAAWNAAWDVAWDVARTAARGAAWDAAWTAAWGVSGGAVWRAAGALVVRDLITPEHFNALYGPWASVMERAEG